MKQSFGVYCKLVPERKSVIVIITVSPRRAWKKVPLLVRILLCGDVDCVCVCGDTEVVAVRIGVAGSVCECEDEVEAPLYAVKPDMGVVNPLGCHAMAVGDWRDILSGIEVGVGTVGGYPRYVAEIAGRKGCSGQRQKHEHCHQCISDDAFHVIVFDSLNIKFFSTQN